MKRLLFIGLFCVGCSSASTPEPKPNNVRMENDASAPDAEFVDAADMMQPDLRDQTCPPGMLIVGTRTATFCMDERPMTIAEFRSAATQPATPTGCDTNELPSYADDLNPEDPAIRLDFCDAAYVCEANGKRLCGHVKGGPLPYTWPKDDQTISQWYMACAGNDWRTYAWGESIRSECELQDSCDSPDGIAGLSGGTWEWEDSCDRTPEGVPVSCRLRGGGQAPGSSPADTMKCDFHEANLFGGQVPAESVGDDLVRIGVRCCADVDSI